jgi:hypothetical protein
MATYNDFDELYAGLMANLPAVIQAGLALETTAQAIKAKTDLLNASSVTVVSTVKGSTITILRGDTLSAKLSDLGDLTNYVSLDFTVKNNVVETDDSATIRIRKNASELEDGLLRLNGDAHETSTDGSITITDLEQGDITIALKANVTSKLSVCNNYIYDIQLIESETVKTLITGTLVVSADVTRLVA